ncbi:MAG: alpha/beta hydrolase [Proteobacteria bacterium]|nr:alpha/beta hydrolase [Pseudomonadota bacterium]
MPVDPQAQAVLDRLPTGALPDLSTVPPTVMRQMFSGMTAIGGAETEAVHRVENRTLPGPGGEIPVRIYTPSAARDLPCLVYFHGGGFVICDLDTHDGSCRSLCNGAQCTVVSVDYRLAPEHKFPAAPEDCYAATRWVVENGASIGIDPARVAVGGDSAGGCLSAVVTLMARARGGPALAHQLLIYPVTNHAFDTASYAENAEGYLLSKAMMQWFWAHYLEKEDDGRDPLASPLRAPDHSGLPPATVITAEFDPLRDEGEAYAARLEGAGVPTSLLRYDGMIHGFFAMTAAIDKARQAVAQACTELRASFR